MKESFLAIPVEFLEKVSEAQQKILLILEKNHGLTNSGFITEADAKLLLKRKSTWFWQMRKSGILPYSKIGKSIYYSLDELNKLVKDSKSSS